MAPSIACAAVTNLPSAEMKNPLSVRNRFPFGSNDETQITEGRTLVSIFCKSDDRPWPAFASGEGVIAGTALGVCGVVAVGVGCDCCVRRDWPRSSVVEFGTTTSANAAMPTAYRKVSQTYLIASYGSTVLNTHGSLIKSAKKLDCDKE